MEKQNGASTETADLCLEKDIGDLLNTIGAQIHQKRKTLGMTRKLLAQLSGVSERHLAQIENEKSNVSISVLVRIARTIDMPMADLIRDRSILS